MSFKKTPKIIIIFTSTILIAYFAFTLLGYIQSTGGPSAGEIDEEVRALLQENLIDRNYLQFEFCVNTQNIIDTQGEETSLPNVPLNTIDHYLVSTVQEDQAVKIEHVSTEYRYDYERRDDERNYTDTYIDRIYYIQIKDDKVYYYYPDENGNYEVKIFIDVNFAKAFSALVFPNDLSMFIRESTLPVFTTKDEGKIETSYNASYDNITEPLYTPFAILNGDDPQSLNSIASCSYTIVDYIDDVIVSSDTLKLRLTFYDIEQFVAYAYETWNDKPYTNDLIENDYPYTQFFVLYFYYNFDEPIEFELPQE